MSKKNLDISNPKEYIWEHKFRPNKVSKCILPSVLRKKANRIVKEGQIQNMLFYGPPGIGKTTLAIAICEELGYDWIIINGSKEGRLIETVRNIVSKFANTMSIDSDGGDGSKIIIYDEFDNSGEVQMAIRGLMDEVSANCRFIFTCNYVNKIIEPIRSRTAEIDFSIPKEEEAKMMLNIFNRCCSILDNEGVKYKKNVLAEVIKTKFPDFRNILNTLQSYSLTGEIDEGILEMLTTRYEVLCKYILNKDFKSVIKWTTANTYDAGIYSQITKTIKKDIDSVQWLEIVLQASEYQYKHAFSADPDITLWAFCVEVMKVI